MPVIHYHHERWDGSGYPFGLKGQDIPIQARIFAVADVFDALTSKRSYRKKSTPDDAVEYLREQANILFDPEIVEALAKLPYAEFIQKEKQFPMKSNKPIAAFAPHEVNRFIAPLALASVFFMVLITWMAYLINQTRIH